METAPWWSTLLVHCSAQCSTVLEGLWVPNCGVWILVFPPQKCFNASHLGRALVISVLPIHESLLLALVPGLILILFYLTSKGLSPEVLENTCLLYLASIYLGSHQSLIIDNDDNDADNDNLHVPSSSCALTSVMLLKAKPGRIWEC